MTPADGRSASERQRALLSKKDLRGVRLTDADLSEADLRGADLRGAWLVGGSLRGALLAGSRWDGAVLLGVAGLADGSELAAATVPGRDPVTAVVGVAGPISGLAYSPDGRLLAVARRRVVEICDGLTGRPLRLLRGHSDRISGLAFSPAGDLLATAWADGAVRVWESVTGAERRGPVTDGPARAIAFSPTAPLLAVGSTTGVLLWDATTGTGRQLRGRPKADVLAYSRDGALLAAIDSGSERVGVYEVATGAVRRRLRRPWFIRWAEVAGIVGAGFSLNGALLFTVARDGTLYIWDMATGRLRSTDTGGWKPGVPVGAVFFTHCGTSYVAHGVEAGSGSVTRHTQFARMTRWGPIERRWHSLPTSAVASTWGGGMDAAGTSGGDLYVWPGRHRPDVRPGRPVHPMADLAFAPDGVHLAVVEPGGWVLIWHLPSGTVHLSFPGLPDPRSRVAFTPDGTGVVVATAHQPARIHDLRTGRVRADEPTTEAEGVPPSGVMGRSPAAGSGVAASPPAVERDRSSVSGPVAVSPDGRLRATGGADGTVRISDVATGAIRHELIGHFDAVPAAAFAPDGERLATASLDGTIRIWDARTGGLQVTLVPRPHGLGAALFADGSYAADGEATDCLWWVAKLQRFAPGELDPYVPGLRRRPPEPAYAGSGNSSVRALLVSLVGQRRAGRARLVVAWAEEQRDADSFAEQVTRLSHCEPEGRFLALIAAGVGRCTGYLTAALSDYHPKLWPRALRASRPVDDGVVARAVLAAPAALRLEAYQIIRRSGRRDLADRLIEQLLPGRAAEADLLLPGGGDDAAAGRL